jgi:hypothetical protein
LRMRSSWCRRLVTNPWLHPRYSRQEIVSSTPTHDSSSHGMASLPRSPATITSLGLCQTHPRLLLLRHRQLSRLSDLSSTENTLHRLHRQQLLLQVWTPLASVPKCPAKWSFRAPTPQSRAKWWMGQTYYSRCTWMRLTRTVTSEFSGSSERCATWHVCMCMYVSATPKNCYAAIFRPTKQEKRKAHGSMASPHVLKTGGLSKFITAAGSTCGTRKKKSRTKFYCQLQARTRSGFSSMVPQHPRSKDVTSGGRVVATSKFCGTTTIAGIERRCPSTQRHWS